MAEEEMQGRGSSASQETADGPDEAEIEAVILTLTAARGAARSICPSEAARALSLRDWRSLMPAIRRVAGRLSRNGGVRVTQRGAPVDPETARGPIRLSAPHDTEPKN